MAGRFIAAEICPILLTLTPTFHSGTRQTPTTVPHPHVPLHCTIPGAFSLPSPPLTLPAASPAGHLSALVYAL